jgi:transposase
MSTSIVLPEVERKQLLTIYRKGPPHLRLRAHILLLLAAGQTWASICTFLFCSSATIQHWKDRYRHGGLPAVLQDRRGRCPGQREAWLVWIVHWILDGYPQDFGFLRSRWCCRLVVVVLLETRQVEVSAETVRRWLHQADMVWRRPRPVLKPVDPEYDQKIQQLRDLLAHLPRDQTAVFQDEVDVNTNPKIGSMWMLRGQQAEVLSPRPRMRPGTHRVSRHGYRRSLPGMSTSVTQQPSRVATGRGTNRSVSCARAASHCISEWISSRLVSAGSWIFSTSRSAA